MTEKRSMEHCLNYIGKPKCRFTAKICNDDYAQICEEYRSDEGTYPCPHCNRTGLKLLDYDSDKVWECMRCGAELWYCETVEEMQRRCKEIKERRLKAEIEQLKKCYNCKYWNCDTGFCEVKMIIVSGKELCEYWRD